MTGLLLDTPMTEEQRECAETVRESTETLLRIISRFSLSFSFSEWVAAGVPACHGGSPAVGARAQLCHPGRHGGLPPHSKCSAASRVRTAAAIRPEVDPGRTRTKNENEDWRRPLAVSEWMP